MIRLTVPCVRPSVSLCNSNSTTTTSTTTTTRTTGTTSLEDVSRGASAGSLFNVYVRVMYEGGRRSNGFISAEALAGSQVLREYTRTDKGQKIAKYVQD